MTKALILIVEDVKLVRKANCLAFVELEPELLCLSTSVGDRLYQREEND